MKGAPDTILGEEVTNVDLDSTTLFPHVNPSYKEVQFKTLDAMWRAETTHFDFEGADPFLNVNLSHIESKSRPMLHIQSRPQLCGLTCHRLVKPQSSSHRGYDGAIILLQSWRAS